MPLADALLTAIAQTPKTPALSTFLGGVCLPFVRGVQWTCPSRSLIRQRLKPNSLPTEQDQNTSSNGENRHDQG
jgi:hypothetical protein